MYLIIVFLFIAPKSVEQVLDLGRPFLPEADRNMIHIYGRNKKVWTEGLRKDFEINQLPTTLGGTRVFKGLGKDVQDF